MVLTKSASAALCASRWTSATQACSALAYSPVAWRALAICFFSTSSGLSLSSAS